MEPLKCFPHGTPYFPVFIAIEGILKDLNAIHKIIIYFTSLLRRPSGVPEEDLCSFLIPYYQKQEKYMQRELKKIQDENAALAQKVQAGRENIARTENHISNVVDEWKVSRMRAVMRTGQCKCKYVYFLIVFGLSH